MSNQQKMLELTKDNEDLHNLIERLKEDMFEEFKEYTTEIKKNQKVIQWKDAEINRLNNIISSQDLKIKELIKNNFI